MKRFRVFLVRAAICFVLPQVVLGGCSLIGFGIGAIIDSSGPEGEILLAELDGLRTGTEIAVTTRDSRRTTGYFIGFAEEDPVRYREKYAAALRESGGEGTVPLPGDNITFAYRDSPGSQEEGVFRGIDVNTMVVNQPGRRVFVSDLGMLAFGDSSQADVHHFRSLVHERKLPLLRRGILVKVNGDSTEVPVTDVTRVEAVGGSHNAKWIGLAIGAVVDGIVTIVAVNSLEESCRENDCYHHHESCNNHENR